MRAVKTHTRIPLASLPERYAFVDPAGKRRAKELKRIGAEAAIVVIATNSLGHVFPLWAWSGRVPSPKLLDLMFNVQRRFQPTQFGCESNAMQELFAELAIDLAKKRNEPIRIIPVYPPTNVDKDWRIRTALQAVVGERRLFMPHKSVSEEIVGPGMKKLREQVEGFPTIIQKDLIDALASAIKMIPPRTLRVEEEMSRAAELLYMRETGGMMGNSTEGDWEMERGEHGWV